MIVIIIRLTFSFFRLREQCAQIKYGLLFDVNTGFIVLFNIFAHFKQVREVYIVYYYLAIELLNVFTDRVQDAKGRVEVLRRYKGLGFFQLLFHSFYVNLCVFVCFIIF